jgi:hypothetical protein
MSPGRARRDSKLGRDRGSARSRAAAALERRSRRRATACDATGSRLRAESAVGCPRPGYSSSPLKKGSSHRATCNIDVAEYPAMCRPTLV